MMVMVLQTLMNLVLATTDLMAVSSALTTLGYNSGPYQGFKA
jgi:hypothetical protein